MTIQILSAIIIKDGGVIINKRKKNTLGTIFGVALALGCFACCIFFYIYNLLDRAVVSFGGNPEPAINLDPEIPLLSPAFDKLYSFWGDFIPLKGGQVYWVGNSFIFLVIILVLILMWALRRHDISKEEKEETRKEEEKKQKKETSLAEAS